VHLRKSLLDVVANAVAAALHVVSVKRLSANALNLKQTKETRRGYIYIYVYIYVCVCVCVCVCIATWRECPQPETDKANTSRLYIYRLRYIGLTRVYFRFSGAAPSERVLF